MPLKKTAAKNAQTEKHSRTSAAVAKVSKSSTGTGSTMKMTVASTPAMTQRMHRKVLRLTGKRLGAHHRFLSVSSGKGRPAIRSPMEHTCDNSDDSGLGFDHHMDGCAYPSAWTHESDHKRRKIDPLKVETDDPNDNYCFPESSPAKNCKENSPTVRSIPCTGIQSIGKSVTQNSSITRNIGRCLPLVNRRSPVTGPVTLTTQLSSISRNGKVHLQIVCQPEQQHRARYQTEGSRGAVKDRTGNSFPIVKLNGYDKPATLQIFIGTDLGRVAPHMFYQACRVSGKNSTPCVEKKIDGTIVIEVDLEPSKDMTATCDCVGILKERNVDVEHRFPEQLSPRSKKKSTKCRMVFRTSITNDDGSSETLQVCSQPIVCTQPPGIPEICKKSLTSCPAVGGSELFILGKNFLKDTRVVFQQQVMYEGERSEVIWEEVVIPDKEFLQQTHLVCTIPPYMRPDITESISVRLYIISSGKISEAHTFTYTPVPPNSANSRETVGMEGSGSTAVPFLSKMLWETGAPKQELDLGMMPPPPSLVPLTQRRPSASLGADTNSPPARVLKTELIDENSQGSAMDHHMISENSIDMRARFRAISESSMDLHHEDSNMGMEFMRRGPHPDALNDNNSNSVHSFHCDKSNHSVHNEDSMEPHIEARLETRIETRPTPDQRLFTQSDLLTAHSLIQSEIDKGIDLRMKGYTDLADTQSPSMATLRRFVVTEPANLPLPTQTAQSVENYLTTIENSVGGKTAVSSTLANNAAVAVKAENDQLLMQTMKTTMLTAGQFLQTEPTVAGTNSILTATTSQEILPRLNESHLKNSQNFDQNLMATSQVMFPTQPLETSQPDVLKQTDASLLLSQQNLQAALNANAALLQNATPTTKLDALVNSTVETHLGSPIKSPPQELLISNKSPLLPSSPNNSPILQNNSPILQNNSPILQNNSPILQNNSPILQNNSQILQNSSPILPNNSPILVSQPSDMLLSHQNNPSAMLNELIIQSSQSELSNPHVSPSTISPEVILNPQVSPSVMCRSPPETLLQVSGSLTTICSPNVLQSNQMQQEIITSESAGNGLLLKNNAVCEERIVLNAAADYLETQKKINEITRMDNRLLQSSLEQQKSQQEQNLINTLLDVGSGTAGQSQVLLQSTGVPNMFVSSTSTQNMLTTMSSDSNGTNTVSASQYLNQVNLNMPKAEPKGELGLEAPVGPAQTPTADMKKSEENMIPQTLTNMSDNDLISLINPSCFDQGSFPS